MRTIELELKPNGDDGINCIVCNRWNCELVFETMGGGRHAWHGIHDRCADMYKPSHELAVKTYINCKLDPVDGDIDPTHNEAWRNIRKDRERCVYETAVSIVNLIDSRKKDYPEFSYFKPNKDKDADTPVQEAEEPKV